MPEDTFSHVAGSNVFLFLYKRLNCGYSSEATLQGTSNVYIRYTVASHYFKHGVGVGVWEEGRGFFFMEGLCAYVSLAWDMPTGPRLHFYQTLSKYI